MGGRSGTMICALLIYSGAVASAYEALRWYARVRGGKNEGVTIPSQIRFLAMFERWLRSSSVGLVSDPMSRTPEGMPKEGELGIPHRLKSLSIGPVKASILQGSRSGLSVKSAKYAPIRLTPTASRSRPVIDPHLSKDSPTPMTSTSSVGSGKGKAGVRVGLASRTSFWKKERAVYWYDEVIVEASNTNTLEVEFDSEDPETIWKELDGALIVIVRRLGISGLRPETITACGWWCHSYFLAEVSDNEDEYNRLVLELSKPCIDSLARDRDNPHDLCLIATFEDLRCGEGRRMSQVSTIQQLASSPEVLESLQSSSAIQAGELSTFCVATSNESE